MPRRACHRFTTVAATILALLATTTAAAAGAGSASPGDVVSVPLAGGLLRLDGRPDEDAWQSAVELAPMVQREPREGDEPSEPTRVLLLSDDDRLYLAIYCYDSEPSRIVRSVMARDADLSQDDNVEVVLDTFLDLRNGYYFQVNSLGARTDGLISNNNDPNRDWDGIWDARSTLQPDGWSVEIAIPYKTLNFAPGGPEWGINVQRTIRRKQESIRWKAPRRSVRLAQVSEAGAVSGFASRRQGRGLDLRPYVSARGASERSAPWSREGDVGLDATKNLTPGLTATLTVNTDFAETEVDARQVNLTRFPLFFAEKRTFFLQNAGLFQSTGLGQRADQSSAQDLVPFFSRRIGLTADGQLLPILAGGKLAGTAGRWNFGVLDVATADDEEIQGENYFVARPSVNVGQQSIVGALVTYGDPTSNDPNPLVGMDGRWSRTNLFGNRNLTIEGALFHTFVVEGSDGDRTAATFRIDYPNDPLGVNVTFKDIGRDFQPGLGFVPRTGIRKGDYNIDYYWRPDRWGIRHNHFELLTYTVHDPDWQLLNWRIFTAPLNLRTESGEHIEWNYMPEYEFLDVPFEIRPGIVISAGGYRMNRYRAELNTATKRALILDLSVRYGDFYDGRRVETISTVRIRVGVHLGLAAGISHNDVSLAAGDFATTVAQGRVDVGFTPNVVWNTLVQYDTVSRVAGVNSRFRWTLRPGNDLFFVVNAGMENTLDDRWVSVYERVVSKLQYTFRF